MTVQIKTIKASGGDYTTLQAFEDAAAISSTNADPWHAECYSGSDLDGFSKGAWAEEPSSEGGRIKIYAAPGHEHDGSWSSARGAYGSISSGWNINSYGQQLDYFTFEGILFLNSKNSTGTVLVSGGGGGMKLELKRCWFYKTHVTVTGQNMYIQTNSSSDASDVLVENCIIRRGTVGLYISTLTSSPAFVGTVRNCTIYGCTVRGLQTGFTAAVTNTFTLQNTICGENPTHDFFVANVDTLVIQNNISTDATADDDGGTGHQINVDEADIWVDAPNGDFRLVHGSKAKDKGVAIAEVVTDITGVQRPQGGYHDCGAYEAKRVGGGRMRSYNRRKGRLRVSDVRARRG